MNQTKVKFEYVLVSLIISIVLGVIVWFMLDSFGSIISIEISVFITTLFISAIITYSLHGRGILPIPESEYYQSEFSSSKKQISYSRKKFVTYSSTKEKKVFNQHSVKKKYFSSSYKRRRFRD